jgi:hypothetical protein
MKMKNDRIFSMDMGDRGLSLLEDSILREKIISITSASLKKAGDSSFGERTGLRNSLKMQADLVLARDNLQQSPCLI